VTFSSAFAQFFARPKKGFLLIQTQISCNLQGEIFEIFSTSSQTILILDPMVTCIHKSFFFQNLVLVLEMAILERFW